MTLKLSYRKKFVKELEKQRKRGKDIKKLREVIEILANEKPLPPRYKNHKLVGNFKDRWECHIEPDWLLIYKLADHELTLERTGSHSDLFKK